MGDLRCSGAVWVEQVAFEVRNIFAVALASNTFVVDVMSSWTLVKTFLGN